MPICYKYHVVYVMVDCFPYSSRFVDILRAEILLDETVCDVNMRCINIIKYLCFLFLIVWVHIPHSSSVEWSLRSSGYAHRQRSKHPRSKQCKEIHTYMWLSLNVRHIWYFFLFSYCVLICVCVFMYVLVDILLPFCFFIFDRAGPQHYTMLHSEVT